MSGRAPTAMELRFLDLAYDPKNFRRLGESARDYLLRMARAHIRMMYEPDESMLAAYMNALERPACPEKEPWHKAKMRKRWRAMIDAASPPEEQQ